MVSNSLLKNINKLHRVTKCHASSSRKLNLWTRENIVQSPYKDIEIPNTLAVNHIWNNVEKWADKTAVVCGITNRSYTYYKLYKRSKNFAANLRTKLKIKDGDVICIMMPNNPEYVITVLGALEAGAVVTTINPIYTNYEVQKHIESTNPKILIGIPDTIEVLKAGLKLANKEANIITVKAPRENLPPDTIAFDLICNDENVDYRVLNEVKRNADDVVFLPYSSGTTGLPKGVELTNRNIAVNLLQTSVEGVKQYRDTTASNQDSIMAVIPFYHIYGLSVIMMHKLSAGLKLVTLPKFNPNAFINTLVDHQISLLYSAPPLILYLANNPEVKKDTLQSIKTVVCAAAPMPKADAQKTLEKLRSDVNYIQMYGLTETSPIATAAAMGDKDYDYTSVGVPVPNTELKIVDSELQTLGPSEIGELWIKGPQVMKGYKDNIEATRNAITEDGWFKSGDLASIDERGNVTILDRIKELIKVKGFQVAPAELEGILKEHPSILDAAVVGIPHEKTGEIPKAFVVIKENKKLDAEEVKGFVKTRVAPFKNLGDVVFLDSLPKNPSGKLLRKEIKEKYC